VTDFLVISDREVYADKTYDLNLVPLGDGTYALSVHSTISTNVVVSPILVVAKGEMFGKPLATQIEIALHDNSDGTFSLGIVRWP
jgi:hypothetical protein